MGRSGRDSCVRVDAVDDADDPTNLCVVREYPHDAVIANIREGRLKEHLLVDRAVLREVGDDGVDEADLVCREGTRMQEVGESCLRGLHVQAQNAPHEFAQRHLAILLLKLFPRPSHILSEQNLLQRLQLSLRDRKIARQLVNRQMVAILA